MKVYMKHSQIVCPSTEFMVEKKGTNKKTLREHQSYLLNLNNVADR